MALRRTGNVWSAAGFRAALGLMPSFRCNTSIARLVTWLGLLAAVVSCRELSQAERATDYDLVIVNGTGMDPASGLDAPRNIGIASGAIRTVTEQGLQGRETLDARGMVVAPGFIDLHQHAQDAAGYRVEVLDGTTTALELEGGTVDIDRWYGRESGRVAHQPWRERWARSSQDGGAARPGEGHANGSGGVAGQHAGGAGADRGDN